MYRFRSSRFGNNRASVRAACGTTGPRRSSSTHWVAPPHAQPTPRSAAAGDDTSPLTLRPDLFNPGVADDWWMAADQRGGAATLAACRTLQRAIFFKPNQPCSIENRNKKRRECGPPITRHRLPAQSAMVALPTITCEPSPIMPPAPNQPEHRLFPVRILSDLARRVDNLAVRKLDSADVPVHRAVVGHPASWQSRPTDHPDSLFLNGALNVPFPPTGSST